MAYLSMVKKLFLTHEVALESEERKHRIALMRAAGMVNSALWGTAMLVAMRWPGAGTISFIAPMLATCGATTEPTRALRMRAVAVNILCVAAVAFVRANLDQQTFLVLVAIFCSGYAVHRLIPGAMSASAIMVAAMLDIGFTDYLLITEFAIAMAVIAPFAAWTYGIIDRVVLGKEDQVGFCRPRHLSPMSSWRRALAFSIAYYLTQVTGYHQSFWITLTVGLCYLNGDTGAKAQHIAWVRFLWSPIAFLGATCWMMAWSFTFYQINYAAPVFCFLGFYTLYRTGEYVPFYLMFTMMITMAVNLDYGFAGVFGNPWNYIFQSMGMIGLGSAIVFLLEIGNDST